MFKNKQQAAKKLAERLKNDRVEKRSLKIISLTKPGEEIARYLKKELETDHPADQNPIIIIVDDGRVSFSKLRGKINQLRQEKVKQILIAMPVYEHEKIRKLEKFADGVYILEQPKVFLSAEDFYQE
jgi:predicted phosphoribosyltransferase